MMARRLLWLLLAAVAGCASVGLGVTIPVGRGGGITVGGSVPLPRPSDTPASAPEPAPQR